MGLAVIFHGQRFGLEHDRGLFHGEGAGEGVDHIALNVIAAAVDHRCGGVAGHCTGVGERFHIIADGYFFAIGKDVRAGNIAAGQQGFAVIGLGEGFDLDHNGVCPLGLDGAAHVGINGASAVHVHADAAGVNQLPAGIALGVVPGGVIFLLHRDGLDLMAVCADGVFVAVCKQLAQLAVQLAVGVGDFHLGVRIDAAEENGEHIGIAQTQNIQNVAAVGLICKGAGGDLQSAAVENGVLAQVEDLLPLQLALCFQGDFLHIKTFGNEEGNAVFLYGRDVGKGMIIAVLSEVYGYFAGVAVIGLCLLIPEKDGVIGSDGACLGIVGPRRGHGAREGEHEHQNQHGAQEYLCCSFHKKSPQE